MEKPRDAQGATPGPNAAPQSAVEDVIRRVRALGLDWEESVIAAGNGRNMAYKLKRYDGGLSHGSMSSLRKVEDWLVEQERKRPKKTASDPQTEWTGLGAELADLDPDEFARALDGVRDVVAAARMKRGGYLKLFRPNPDR